MINSIVLKSFIFLSPYIRNKVNEQTKLIEISGYLRSTRSFELLRNVAQQIQSPVGRLFEVLSKDIYNDPQLFSVSNLPDCYLGMNLVCIAQALRHRGELGLAFKMCLEAFRLSVKWGDAVSVYQAQKELAILQSLDGNHKSSLELLENTLPLVRSIAPRRPALYYDHFNSLAVELCEFGRIEEARINVQFALASPFADKYPGTYETARDIAAKTVRASRGRLALNESIPVNVENVNFAPMGQVSFDSQGPAKLFDLLEWKAKMRNNQTKKKNDEKTYDEKLTEFLRLIHDLDPTENQLDRMLDILKEGDESRDKQQP